MPIADLPDCLTRPQIEEAIVKPVAYALAPSPVPLLHVRRVLSRRHGMHAARSFCHGWGIQQLWQFHDPATGFELILFGWQGRSYLVAIGSNDATDWKRNLTQLEVGLAAYRANQSAVKEAIGRAASNAEIIVAGHSLGGAVAQYIAIDHPGVTHCLTYQTAAVPPEFVAKSFDRDMSDLQTAHHLHISDPVYPLSKRRCDGGLILGLVAMHGDRVHGFDRIKAHSLMLSLLPTTG
jgi:predicted esterase